MPQVVSQTPMFISLRRTPGSYSNLFFSIPPLVLPWVPKTISKMMLAGIQINAPQTISKMMLIKGKCKGECLGEYKGKCKGCPGGCKGEGKGECKGCSGGCEGKRCSGECKGEGKGEVKGMQRVLRRMQRRRILRKAATTCRECKATPLNYE